MITYALVTAGGFFWKYKDEWTLAPSDAWRFSTLRKARKAFKRMKLDSKLYGIVEMPPAVDPRVPLKFVKEVGDGQSDGDAGGEDREGDRAPDGRDDENRGGRNAGRGHRRGGVEAPGRGDE